MWNARRHNPEYQSKNNLEIKKCAEGVVILPQNPFKKKRKE